MKKGIMFLMLIIMTLVVSACQGSDQEFTEGDFVYVIDKDGYSSIIRVSDNSVENEYLTIPDFVRGYPVRIGKKTSVMTVLFGEIESEHVKKIYIVSSVWKNKSLGLKKDLLQSLEKIILINGIGYSISRDFDNSMFQGSFIPAKNDDILNDEYF